MRVNNKKTMALLFLAGCVVLGYWFWLCLRPVEIVAVHEDDNHASVLVKTFPFTDKGKISWWLKNKNMLKEKYNIPKPSPSGNFTVIFWDFGDGYKEEGKYDRRCFNDMKTKVNCIEKNAVFAVRQYHDDDVIFATYEGRYSLNKNSDIIKVESD